FALVPDLVIFSKIELEDVVPAVEVLVMFTRPLVVPLPVQVFPDVVISARRPVVTESDTKYKPVPEVIAVASKIKPDEVVVPVVMFEVNVCELLAVVTLNAPP